MEIVNALKKPTENEPSQDTSYASFQSTDCLLFFKRKHDLWHGRADRRSVRRVKEIISRQDAADTSGRPMLREKWAGVIDTVGGEILATAIKSTRLNGNITCCGNMASPNLPLTVFPFILRGVSIFVVYCGLNM